MAFSISREFTPYFNVHAPDNLAVISKHANQKAEFFRVETSSSVGHIIQVNGLFQRLFLRAKHAIWGGGEEHRLQLRQLIDRDISFINRHTQIAYKDESAYTELFLTVQRYNHARQMHLNPDLRHEVALFDDLSLDASIHPESCPEVAAIDIRVDQIVREDLQGIPQEQQPSIRLEGFWHRHRVYHYNEEDREINHGKEAAHIFVSTQKERLLSLIGRTLEKGFALFHVKRSFFKEAHYFRHGEDKGDMIYAQDAPLSSQMTPSSYWIGHATCLLQVPVKTQSSPICINLITDPVESDLSRLLGVSSEFGL